MKLQMHEPIAIERTEPCHEVVVSTWEAAIWIVVDEVISADVSAGFITKILPYEDLSQLEELQPFLSVVCAVVGDDFFIVQRRTFL